MKLFTANWCSQCKPVKQFIDTNNLDVELIDVDTEEGANVASSLGIRGLPTLIDGSNTIVGSKILAYLEEK